MKVMSLSIYSHSILKLHRSANEAVLRFRCARTKMYAYAPVLERLHFRRLCNLKLKRLYKLRKFALAASVGVCLLSSAAAVALSQADVRERIAGVFAGEAVVENVIENSRDLKLLNKELVAKFYYDREDKPFWHRRNGKLKIDAKDFIKSLEASWTHGLNPANYNLDLIAQLRGREDAVHVLDVVLTDSFMRYVRDLSGMRVAASQLRLRKKDWLQPYAASKALEFMDAETDFDEVAEKIIPKSGTYKRLQKELKKMAKAGGLDVEQPRVSFGRVVLRPGQSHKNVPVLRERLGVEPYGDRPRVYDDKLAAAVMKFQRENGLKVDGVLGGQTVHVLNLGPRDRYLQIIANMERLRWKPEPTHDRFIVVNVPSAMLWAIDGERVELEMPVVVGKPKRETEIFITHINGIRINPDWTLPPTIKHEDIVPAVLKDPEYLRKKGITVYSSYGRDAVSLDAASVDWASLSKADLKGMRMVQPPSRYNPLGQYRVLMPNQYNIYLHDTNQKRHFDLVDRARSSGCIRMSDPRAVADFVFKESQWEGERFEKILKRGKKADLMVSEKMPVYIFYYTIWIDDEAKLVFGNDLYGRDARLIKALESIDGFVFPSHNG